ncbi:hypothetical protein E2C01_086452 [Portunus trituberculatus]|uniref:Uncharacterized protein n=1 Tax=Portunus trituberculatus TaxID=210409 RepID=A0A5B7JDI4_PORTR|nr:hypothetical protein [Portunus trituberculatus]
MKPSRMDFFWGGGVHANSPLIPDYMDLLKSDVFYVVNARVDDKEGHISRCSGCLVGCCCNVVKAGKHIRYIDSRVLEYIADRNGNDTIPKYGERCFYMRFRLI